MELILLLIVTQYDAMQTDTLHTEWQQNKDRGDPMRVPQLRQPEAIRSKQTLTWLYFSVTFRIKSA